MTSTNDGKDVRSIQTSGQKGKSYYIELYKNLEARLSSECDLVARTHHLCDAWRLVYSLCQHSSSLTHPHLLSWLQRHTAKIVLQSEWQSPKSKNERSSLEDAINAYIHACEAAAAARDGDLLPWESQLLQRAEWFKSVLSNPWGHPVLKVLLDPRGEALRDDQIIEWLKEERGMMFVTRLRHLSASKCDDLALSLASAVMDRVRASMVLDPDAVQTKEEEPQNPQSSFAKVLHLEAGFTGDVLEILTDIEFVLLHKYDGETRCIQLARQIPLPMGCALVERLRTRLESSPKEKRLWKNAKEVATLISQVVIARCMVVPVCADACRKVLFQCARSLARLLGARLPPAARSLAAPAASARHLHTLAAAVDKECSEEMRPFVCELYVRAITAGMNELERLKLHADENVGARLMEQTLAEWFVQLGRQLVGSARLLCECTLTAFSVHPSPLMFQQIRDAPSLPTLPPRDVQESREASTSEFGSWARDSRSQTNLVKTSETLNLKQNPHQANVLSTAILAEGEALGLSAELCQDLAVLLSGPRVKTLSWDMKREDLLENGRAYMERTHGGTKALTTELKYLNLDPKNFLHLPEEEDDIENDYYGIEKGYEHLVVPLEPEEIWEDTFWRDDGEKSDSDISYQSEIEIDIKPRRKKKSKAHRQSSDGDSDPLSLMAEEKKKSEKKERPHSKERSKKTSLDRETSKDRRKDRSHSKEKLSKKSRKKRDKTTEDNNIPLKSGSLSSFLGMKVMNEDSNKMHQACEQPKTSSVTDSDYNSQGKFSLNSEGHDPNVIVDGIFPMDEIKSERTTIAKNESTTNSLTKTKSSLPPKDQNRENKTGRRPQPNMLKRSESNLELKGHSTQVNSLDLKSNNSLVNNEDTKNSIVKLLQFRKKKSEDLSVANSQKAVVMSQGDNQSHPGIGKVSEIDTFCSFPKNSLIGARVLKPQQQTSMFTYKIPQASTSTNTPGEKKINKNKLIANKSVNQQIQDKQNVQSLNATNSFHNLLNQKVSTVPVSNLKLYRNLSKNKETNETNMTHLESYEVFLKDLQVTINAGAEEVYSEHQKVKKDLPKQKHSNNLEPSKADIKIPPQCAKQFPTNIPEKAPSTFSRLSYMHRNKQSDTKPKLSASSVIVRNNFLSESNNKLFDELMSDLRQNKMHMLKKDKEFNVQSVRTNDNSNSTKNYPLLSNILHTSTLNSDHSSKTLINQKDKEFKESERTKISIGPNRNTLLSDKDQQDLLSILRQKSNLNSTAVCNKADIQSNNTNKVKSNISQTSTFNPKMDNEVNNATTPYQKEYCASLQPPTHNLPLKTNCTPATYNSPTINKNVVQTKTKPSAPQEYNSCLTPGLVNSDFDSKMLLEPKGKVALKDAPKQDWASVLDALLSHKTPSRGLSARDILSGQLNMGDKQSRETGLRNHRIVRTKPQDVVKNEVNAQVQPMKVKSTADANLRPDQSEQSDRTNSLVTPDSIKVIQQNKQITLQQKQVIKSAPNVSKQKNLKSTKATQETQKYNKIKKTQLHNNKVVLDNQKMNLEQIVASKEDRAIITSLKNRDVSVIVNPSQVKRNQNESINLSSSSLKTVGQNIVIKPQINKCIGNSVELQKIDANKFMKNYPNAKSKCQRVNQIETKKLLPETSKKSLHLKSDPFISGLQNSEYDLIEELMDDDLRQEIGELLSDEEELYSSPATFPKYKDNITCSQSNVCNKSINLSSDKPNTYQKCHQNREGVNLSIDKLKTDQHCLRIPRSVNVSSEKSKTEQQYLDNTQDFMQARIKSTNIINNNESSSNTTLRTNRIVDTKSTAICRNNNSANENKISETNVCDNIIYQMPENHGTPRVNKSYVDGNSSVQMNINPTQLYVAPHPTALQNVVLIGSELVYETYPTIHIQETQINTNLADVSNTFVTVSNIPNMALYQTTQFAAPVINPLIIGNATTEVKRVQSVINTSYNNLPQLASVTNSLSKYTDSSNTKDDSSFESNDDTKNDSSPKTDSISSLSVDSMNNNNNLRQFCHNNNIKVQKDISSIKTLNFERERNCNNDKQNVKKTNMCNSNITTPKITNNNFNEDESDKLIGDCNLIKYNERRVLSEVQEKLKPEKTDKLSVNCKQTSDIEIKKEQERLKKKRLSLINRQSTYRIYYPPIPLSYTPLRETHQTINKTDNEDIPVVPTVDKLLDMTPTSTDIQEQTKNSRVLDVEYKDFSFPEIPQSQVDNKETRNDQSKENKDDKMFLRSSNELNSKAASPATDTNNSFGIKTKVRLKRSINNAKEQNDNDSKIPKPLKGKKKPKKIIGKRISKRLANKVAEEFNHDETSETLSKKDTNISKDLHLLCDSSKHAEENKGYIDSTDYTKNDEENKGYIDSTDYIDIESTLTGTKILKRTLTLDCKPENVLNDFALSGFNTDFNDPDLIINDMNSPDKETAAFTKNNMSKTEFMPSNDKIPDNLKYDEIKKSDTTSNHIPEQDIHINCKPEHVLNDFALSGFNTDFNDPDDIINNMNSPHKETAAFTKNNISNAEFMPSNDKIPDNLKYDEIKKSDTTSNHIPEQDIHINCKPEHVLNDFALSGFDFNDPDDIINDMNSSHKETAAFTKNNISNAEFMPSNDKIPDNLKYDEIKKSDTTSNHIPKQDILINCETVTGNLKTSDQNKKSKELETTNKNQSTSLVTGDDRSNSGNVANVEMITNNHAIHEDVVKRVENKTFNDNNSISKKSDGKNIHCENICNNTLSKDAVNKTTSIKLNEELNVKLIEKDKLQSVKKDDLIITEITNQNNANPNERQLRIKMGNNKNAYKVTIFGKLKTLNSKKLEENPKFKSFLSKNLNGNSKHSLNITKCLDTEDIEITTNESVTESSQNTAKRSESLMTSKEENTKSVPPIVDIVDLLSDDEEPSNTVSETSFGKYTIKNLHHLEFQKHQEKLKQKCYVNLSRIDDSDVIISKIEYVQPDTNSVIAVDDKNNFNNLKSIEIDDTLYVDQVSSPNIIHSISKNNNLNVTQENLEVIEIDDSNSEYEDDLDVKIKEFKNLLLHDYRISPVGFPMNDKDSTSTENVDTVKDEIENEKSVLSLENRNSIDKCYDEMKHCYVKLVNCDNMLKKNVIDLEYNLENSVELCAEPPSPTGSLSILQDFTFEEQDIWASPLSNGEASITDSEVIHQKSNEYESFLKPSLDSNNIGLIDLFECEYFITKRFLSRLSKIVSNYENLTDYAMCSYSLNRDNTHISDDISKDTAVLRVVPTLCNIALNYFNKYQFNREASNLIKATNKLKRKQTFQSSNINEGFKKKCNAIFNHKHLEYLPIHLPLNEDIVQVQRLYMSKGPKQLPLEEEMDTTIQEQQPYMSDSEKCNISSHEYLQDLSKQLPLEKEIGASVQEKGHYFSKDGLYSHVKDTNELNTLTENNILRTNQIEDFFQSSKPKRSLRDQETCTDKVLFQFYENLEVQKIQSDKQFPINIELHNESRINVTSNPIETSNIESNVRDEENELNITEDSTRQSCMKPTKLGDNRLLQTLNLKTVNNQFFENSVLRRIEIDAHPLVNIELDKKSPVGLTINNFKTDKTDNDIKAEHVPENSNSLSTVNELSNDENYVELATFSNEDTLLPDEKDTSKIVANELFRDSCSSNPENDVKRVVNENQIIQPHVRLSPDDINSNNAQEVPIEDCNNPANTKINESSLICQEQSINVTSYFKLDNSERCYESVLNEKNILQSPEKKIFSITHADILQQQTCNKQENNFNNDENFGNNNTREKDRIRFRDKDVTGTEIEISSIENEQHSNSSRDVNFAHKSTVISTECIDSKMDISDIQQPEESASDTSTVTIQINNTLKESNGSTSTRVVLKGIEYKDPIIGKCYVFPLVKAPPLYVGPKDNSKNLFKVVKNIDYRVSKEDLKEDQQDFKLNMPKTTYSRGHLKRKLDMGVIKMNIKKYKKSKNIDHPKLTLASMKKSGYCDEYRFLTNYYKSVKFSYSRPFNKESIYVHDLMKDWPIKGICTGEVKNGYDIDDNLFGDVENIQIKDPKEQSFPEEINATYKEIETFSDEVDELNFNTGFGEGSGRVIQNLKSGCDFVKFSAATLSDVKQTQPFLSFSRYNGNNNKYLKVQEIYKEPMEIIQRHLMYMEIRNNVRLFFQKTNLLRNLNGENFYSKPYIVSVLSGLYRTEHMKPYITNPIVQVVQVGQLPVAVSAAAQNPVTCDPRVTHVSDASPPQCSVENSPSGESQAATKTQYTELTTADITLPLVQEYVQQNQINIEPQQANVLMSDRSISIDLEIKSDDPNLKENSEVKSKDNTHETVEMGSVTSTSISNIEFPYDTSTNNSNAPMGPEPNVEIINSTEILNSSVQAERGQNAKSFSREKDQSAEKIDQIAHAMNAAGISTIDADESARVHTLVNVLTQKLQQNAVNASHIAANTHSKTTPINAMALQQALAQILPPPLNQTNSSESIPSAPNTSVTSQVLHIVQGKNSSGNQITLVDNSQQSVINNPNATQVLHIVQNKGATSTATTNGASGSQPGHFSGLSLVDAGLQQGGNQLLHIVNTGQKNNNTGQIIKRVNLVTNLQGSSEQKVVQFVCKSADGKAIHLNAPHQRSMVLRLQPIESSNVQTVSAQKPIELQDLNSTANTTNTASLKENTTTQQEIKSRSVYEENYAKFIQNSSPKPVVEKSTSLPKFNQAFGKPVFQDSNQKQSDVNADNTHLQTVNTNTHLQPVNTNEENNHCPPAENTLNLEHMEQISSPPLLLRKTVPPTSQSQPNLVQQLKQSIAPMNIQTMHGGVIYTRQIPVNIGGGQTINLITVPSTELVDDSGQKHQADVKFVNQNEIEPSIIKIVPQTQSHVNNDVSADENNANLSVNNENSKQTQPQPQQQPQPQVLTQMRIKLPMLSKAPQMVPGARVVRPSFLQIQRNVIGGSNQPVYQQLVLTTAPPLGQQTIRLPQTQTQPSNSTPQMQTQAQTQASRQVKVPTESQSGQSSTESQMSSSTLEQLREFDMVLEQVKERSTVQPNTISNNSFNKMRTASSDTTDSTASPTSSSTESPQQILYSIGNNTPINVAYVNRKPSNSTPTTSTFVRSPDSSGIVDSPNSSSHIPHTITSESSSNDQPSQPKSSKSSSKSKSRPKSSSQPNSLKINNVPPKTSTQKPLEDEQTTQRILYILAEYKEQVENSPDKDKPAPRRRNNLPTNTVGGTNTSTGNSSNGTSKRKKSSSSSRRSGRDVSPIDDGCRTMGSEDSSCGTSQGDCTESCLESHSPQDSPRKIVRKLTFEQETPVAQPRPLPHRNVIVADGQTITVARGTTGKPTTAVLMPANYILPVSMVKSGQQIAIVTNRGPKLITVGGGEGGTTNALLLQRLIGPGLKPVLARPGVRHVRLPAAALQNLQAFNLATTTTVNSSDNTPSSASGPTPPDLVDTRATSSPWTDRGSQETKLDRSSSPEDSEPWNLVTSADPHDYSYEETVRTDNMDRTVLDPIPDRYSPDMEAQRIFDKMFDVDSKRSFIVDSHDDSPRCGYDIDASDCDDKAYHQVVQRKDGVPHRQHRLTHVSAAALRHKYAILEHELRLQKSLSEECEDLGVDSPSASELFPEADLLFAASPAHEQTQEQGPHSHTPQPTNLNQSSIPQADIDDQIATDQLLSRDHMDRQEELGLGLEDVGIVTVSEDGMRATIALDQEEFARSHPNTTFHSEPTDDGVVQPFTISNMKGRQVTSIYHSNGGPATVLMTAQQSSVISQAADTNAIKYADIDNMIDTLPHNDINLPSVLVKDDGLTRFDGILNDTRELHLSNTASAIVHSTGGATQVIRRVCYDDKRESRFLMEDPVHLIAGDDAKMTADDRDEIDDDRSSPERHGELFWESNSASERSESRRPLDFSSDSDKCCKSPYDETNSTDSSGIGAHMRLDTVIKEARGGVRGARRGGERSASDGSSDEMHPPLRTYPAKRSYGECEASEAERSVSGKTRAGEQSPELRRRASNRGVVKRGCHCCNGDPEPNPPRPKKPRQRKPTLDFNA